MTRFDWSGRVILAAFCFILLPLFLLTAYREALALVGSGVTPAAKYAKLANNELVPGFSSQAHANLLTDCISSMVGLFGKLQPEGRQLKLAQSCHENAMSIADVEPTNGLAWVAAAIASGQLKDRASFDRELIQAQVTAPNESWLALTRFNLTVDQIEWLGGDVTKEMREDLALLISLDSTRFQMAQSYVADERLRPRMADVVQELPPLLQERFVAAIKTAAALVRR